MVKSELEALSKLSGLINEIGRYFYLNLNDFQFQYWGGETYAVDLNDHCRLSLVNYYLMDHGVQDSNSENLIDICFMDISSAEETLISGKVENTMSYQIAKDQNGKWSNPRVIQENNDNFFVDGQMADSDKIKCHISFLDYLVDNQDDLRGYFYKEIDQQIYYNRAHYINQDTYIQYEDPKVETVVDACRHKFLENQVALEKHKHITKDKLIYGLQMKVRSFLEMFEPYSSLFFEPSLGEDNQYATSNAIYFEVMITNQLKIIINRKIDQYNGEASYYVTFKKICKNHYEKINVFSCLKRSDNSFTDPQLLALAGEEEMSRKREQSNTIISDLLLDAHLYSKFKKVLARSVFEARDLDATRWQYDHPYGDGQ